MNESRIIWKMDQKIRAAYQRDSDPGFKEHVLAGYRYMACSTPKVQIEDLSRTVKQKQLTLPGGAQVTYLLPHKKTKNVLISLHGGPESFEGTEIRYLGLYRRLLRKGWTVAIFNYRGSKGLSIPETDTWHNWKASILHDFQELQCNLATFHKNAELHLLGASFGGALALVISQNFRIHRCILLSPLLDLRAQKARGGKPYVKWFSTRFSKKDETDFSFVQLVQRNTTATLAICGFRDEVLGSALNRRLAKLAKQGPGQLKVISQYTLHAPRRFSACSKRFNSAFKWLTC